MAPFYRRVLRQFPFNKEAQDITVVSRFKAEELIDHPYSGTILVAVFVKNKTVLGKRLLLLTYNPAKLLRLLDLSIFNHSLHNLIGFMVCQLKSQTIPIRAKVSAVLISAKNATSKL